MIEKGKSWGKPINLSQPIRTFEHEHQLAWGVFEAYERGKPLTCHLETGDLLKNLGAVENERNALDGSPVSGSRLSYSMDLCVVSLAASGPSRAGTDDSSPRSVPFVSHLLARQPFWGGEVVFVMNGSFWSGPVVNTRTIKICRSSLKIGIKAHPNNGLVEVTRAQVPFRQRTEAWHRAKTGSHSDHPQISRKQLDKAQIELRSKTRIWADGHPIGCASVMFVSIIRDAYTLVV